jgi:hypothetical protein
MEERKEPLNVKQISSFLRRRKYNGKKNIFLSPLVRPSSDYVPSNVRLDLLLLLLLLTCSTIDMIRMNTDLIKCMVSNTTFFFLMTLCLYVLRSGYESPCRPDVKEVDVEIGKYTKTVDIMVQDEEWTTRSTASRIEKNNDGSSYSTTKNEEIEQILVRASDSCDNVKEQVAKRYGLKSSEFHLMDSIRRNKRMCGQKQIKEFLSLDSVREIDALSRRTTVRLSMAPSHVPLHPDHPAKGSFDPRMNTYLDCIRDLQQYDMQNDRDESSNDVAVFIATDDRTIADYFVERLDSKRLRVGYNGDINDSRMRNVRGGEKIGDKKQTHSALLDLLIISRARHLIGTRFSTFSMLAASMQRRDEHYMVHAHLPQCVRATSPYHSLFEHHGTMATTGTFSLTLGELSSTSCFNEASVQALQSLTGTFDPTLRNSIAYLGCLNERQEERVSTENSPAVELIRKYRRLHQRMMDPDDPGPKRFYVARTYSSNTGNRAVGLMAHLILAIESGRALVMDGSWFDGFAMTVEEGHDVNLDVRMLPEPYRTKVLSRRHVLGGARTAWMAQEEGMCEDYRVPIDAPDMYLSHFDESWWWIQRPPEGLNVGYLRANPYLRSWIDDKIGPSGKDFRVLTRWFFRPSRTVLKEVRRIEMHVCGKSPCDIGVHVRYGRGAKDHYFPRSSKRDVCTKESDTKQLWSWAKFS